MRLCAAGIGATSDGWRENDELKMLANGYVQALDNAIVIESLAELSILQRAIGSSKIWLSSTILVSMMLPTTSAALKIFARWV